MKTYSVDEAFELLKQYKITSHKESVRRWLMQGVLQGIKPETRKQGWLIPEDSLFQFIRERLPSELIVEPLNTTNDKEEIDSEKIREEM